MKIMYKMDSDDVVAFNLEHLRVSEKMKKKVWRGRLGLSFIYGVIAVFLLIYNRDFWPFSWLLIFFSILWFVFYSRVLELRVRKKILKAYRGREYSLYELDLNGQRMMVTVGGRSECIDWEKVKRLVQTGEHIFMYFSEEDAVIVPRKKLIKGDWGQLNEFISLLTS